MTDDWKVIDHDMRYIDGKHGKGLVNGSGILFMSADELIDLANVVGAIRRADAEAGETGYITTHPIIYQFDDDIPNDPWGRTVIIHRDGDHWHLEIAHGKAPEYEE